MAKKRAKTDQTAGESAKSGRPERTFTREEIDAAAELLGRFYYASRVATLLSERFADMGRDVAYRLIDVARAETVAAMTDAGGSPLVETYMGLRALAFGEKTKDIVKVQALNGMAKLLGMHKLIKQLQDAGDIENFLAEVMRRRAGRVGVTPAASGSAPSANGAGANHV